MHDGALIDAARAGSSDAFVQLQRLYLPELWDFAVRCTLDAYAATEVVREVFLRAAARLSHDDMTEPFGVMLYALTVRQLAFREPPDPSLAADQPRYHGWPDETPYGPVAFEHTRSIWTTARRYGPEYKLLDLHLRHGFNLTELAKCLGLDADTEFATGERLRSLIADLDAAHGNVGDDGLTATLIFSHLTLVELPHDTLSALSGPLREVSPHTPGRPRALAGLGIAAVAILATAGSLKAFSGDKSTSVLGAQQTRPTVSQTTITLATPVTLAPGPPLRVTTTTTTAPPDVGATKPGSTTTTTRRILSGPFIPPIVTLPPADPPPGDPTTTTTARPTTTTAPGATTTAVPGTTTTTTLPRTTTTVPGTTTSTTSTSTTTTSTTSTTTPPTTTTTPATTTTATTTTVATPTTTSTTTSTTSTTTTTLKP